MKEYLSGINSVHVTPSRRKQSDSLATPSEVDDLRRLCGELLWLVIGAVPHACGLASSMHQRIPRLKVSDTTWANRRLHQLHFSPTSIRFRPPPHPFKSVNLNSFSDADFNLHSSNAYEQSGYVSGVKIHGTNIFHPLDWRSSKQRHVSYSSYGAESLHVLSLTIADSILNKASPTFYEGTRSAITSALTVRGFTTPSRPCTTARTIVFTTNCTAYPGLMRST